MSAVALLRGDVCVYWGGVFAALGALAALLGAHTLLSLRGGRGRELAALFPVAVLFSLVLGRLAHWYCHPLQYAGFAAAMTDYATGGFALPGAFAGTLLAAALLRLGGLSRDLPGLLDALSPAGALGVAVGRMGSLFDASDRGFVLAEEGLHRLPFAMAVTAAGGGEEWRFATFLWQTAAAALTAMVLALFFFRRDRRKGDVFWLFLALYGAAQTVLDSTRYDGGYLRANGFISLTQLLSMASFLVAAAVFALRALRAGAWILSLSLLAGTLLGCAGAGYMEYYVQRHGNEYAAAYAFMSLCLLLALGAVLGLRRAGMRKHRPVLP